MPHAQKATAKRSALLGAAVAALTIAIGAGSAFGAGTNVDLTIKSVSATKAEYKGRIESDNPDCVEGRLIKVSSRGTRLVKTRSDDAGRFSEVGKRPESGAPLKLKVVAKGDECEQLIETTHAQ
jgi:hypothetical protein